MKQTLLLLKEIYTDIVLALKLKRTRVILLVIVIALVIFALNTSTADVSVPQVQEQVVELTTPSEYVGSESVSVIGTVRSISEAKITSERSGRVVSVPVTLGQSIISGAVIARLENASEQAAVLQAEGAYEAALAASTQSNIGVNEANTDVLTAQNEALSDLRSAFNTTNGIVVNSIDTFFADQSGSVPGLRLNGGTYTSFLNNERVAFQQLLPQWKSRVDALSLSSDIQAELSYAKDNVQRVLSVVDIFILLLNDQSPSSRYTSSELLTFSTSFTSIRETLIGTINTLDRTTNNISSTLDALERAKVGGTGGSTSIADAQVKQALGSLRSAQASLAKTIIRTPISGTVNSLSVRTGDFINSFEQVAVVANNNAYEIVAFVSDRERDLLAIDDMVTIEDSLSGVVTNIAPAVDPLTKKIEVRIAAEDINLTNGETVRITKNVEANKASRTIQIPLTAVRFTQKDGFVLQVIDGSLEMKPVTVGKVAGNSIEITSGLESNEAFVVDARGLVIGQSVTVATN